MSTGDTETYLKIINCAFPTGVNRGSSQGYMGGVLGRCYNMTFRNEEKSNDITSVVPFIIHFISFC